jgi:hypothetical protein
LGEVTGGKLMDHPAEKRLAVYQSLRVKRPEKSKADQIVGDYWSETERNTSYQY